MGREYQRRKVSPKVRDGTVQKKNNHRPTAALGYVFARESPAKGHRHVVTKRDIRLLISIIPNWHSLSKGLESIVLTSCGENHDGRYVVFDRERTASIQIPAWEGELWRVVAPEYHREHSATFDLLGVVCEPREDGTECRFTLEQAKAFLLLHVFLHELGHHVDRMDSKSQRTTRRGEPFAESYANELCSVIWHDYVRIFGDPRR